jgi:quinol monooxygenase YgiN
MLRLLGLGGVVALAAMAIAPSAAAAGGATFFTVTYVEVGPLLAKVGAAALRAYREAARQDKGAVSLDVYQRIARPNQFAVLGAWTDEAAFAAHGAADHSRKLADKLATMLAAPVDTRTHAALSVEAGKPGRDRLVVITHVDVVPPEKDNGANALEQLADQSRKQSGNLAFDVWRQSNRPNHFTVVESWANHGAFDLHQMQKETREFRSKLAPMSGALYDERLYKTLP